MKAEWPLQPFVPKSPSMVTRVSMPPAPGDTSPAAAGRERRGSHHTDGCSPGRAASSSLPALPGERVSRALSRVTSGGGTGAHLEEEAGLFHRADRKLRGDAGRDFGGFPRAGL